MSEELTPYQRGQESGRIEARLANHDQHFAQINGSIDRLVEAVSQLHSSTNATLAETRGAREREARMRGRIASAAAILGVVLTIIIVTVNLLTA